MTLDFVDVVLWTGLGVSVVLFLYYMVTEPILINGYVVDIGRGLFRAGGGVIYSSDSYIGSAGVNCKKKGIFKFGRSSRNYSTHEWDGGE